MPSPSHQETQNRKENHPHNPKRNFSSKKAKLANYSSKANPAKAHSNLNRPTKTINYSTPTNFGPPTKATPNDPPKTPLPLRCYRSMQITISTPDPIIYQRLPQNLVDPHSPSKKSLQKTGKNYSSFSKHK